MPLTTHAPPLPSLRRRTSTRKLAWALGCLSALPLLGAGVEAAAAGSVVPAGADFKIWYYKTDENGERVGGGFSANDLAGYVNRARCECAQNISTKVLLSPASGGTYNTNTRVQSFVGSRCDQAVGTFNPQIKPCVRIIAGFPNAYTKAVNFEFAPVWLAGGVDTAGTVDLGDATPSGTCAKGQGDAGVWICIEDGMFTDCQANEFQVTGTQNQNSTGSAMGATPAGIHYDFEPPQNLPTASSFSISEGDGKVVVSWELLTTGDIAGYRLLCADEDGNPLPDKGIDAPPLKQINVGKLYFTKDNLCPNGPFGEDVGVESDGTDGGSGSDSGGSSSGTSSGTSDGGSLESGTSVGLDLDQSIDGFAHASSSSSSGDATLTTTGASSDSGSGSETGIIGGEIPSDGIMSMKWSYVCSGHIGGTSHEATVTGLENGKTYQFAIVAYDLAGNPIVASGDLPLTASPRETVDLWEQCEADGNICGDGGFCNCALDGEPSADALWLVAVAGIGASRMRRRRRGSK